MLTFNKIKVGCFSDSPPNVEQYPNLGYINICMVFVSISSSSFKIKLDVTETWSWEIYALPVSGIFCRIKNSKIVLIR